MMSRKSGASDHLLGLDIGSSFMKLARISWAEEEGRIHLDALGILPTPLGGTPQGAFLEGRIQNMDALAGSISHLLKAMGITQKSLALAVDRSSAMLRRFSSFNTPDSGLEEVISAQAETYFPHALDHLNLDFQVMESAFFSQEGPDILTVAVKKDQALERMELARLTGLNLVILDVEPLALQNIFQRISNKDDPQAYLLVDMGEQGSSLIFVADNEPVMVRENMAGVWQILHEIQEYMNVETQEARQILKGRHGLENPRHQERLMEICRGNANAWCMEIQDQLRFYHDENPPARVEKIFLSGGGANVGQFPARLAQVLDIPVSVFNPLEKIQTRDTRFFPSREEISGPETAIALGLALRKPEDF